MAPSVAQLHAVEVRLRPPSAVNALADRLEVSASAAVEP